MVQPGDRSAMLKCNVVRLILVLACSALTPGRVLAGDECSLELLKASAARAAEACTLVLNQDGATANTRVEALKVRGRAMQRLDRYGDAIADYEAGLRIAPQDPELHMRRGWTAYEQLRRAPDASRRFVSDPALETAFNLALDQGRQALNLKPDYAEAYALIAATLLVGAPERFAETKAAYDEAVRLQPTDPEYRLHRSILLRRNGFLPEAIEDTDAILRLPADVNAKPSATKLYWRPTTYRVSAAIARAEMLTELGRTNEARQAYDSAVERDPDPITYTQRAAFNLTQTAASGGISPSLFDLIQDDLDKASALDPDYWVVHEKLGYLHDIRKQFDLAATEFARALKQFPGNGRMRWEYALVLRRLGRSEEAAGEAITAFRLDPGFMVNKLGMLRKRGYLAAIKPDADPRPALMDAVRACMLDERCG